VNTVKEGKNALAEIPQKPFILYLRGFTPESEYAETERRNPLHKLTGTSVSFERRVEFSVASAISKCAKTWSVVLLHNPVDDIAPADGFKVIVATDDNWESIVLSLVQHAALIVMSIETWTEGIHKELAILGNDVYSRNVIIVVGRNLAIERSEQGRNLKPKLAGIGTVMFERRSGIYSALAWIFWIMFFLGIFIPALNSMLFPALAGAMLLWTGDEITSRKRIRNVVSEFVNLNSGDN
jgi:hypothetical protein